MSFLQNIFNDISLQRDQALWMSADDSRTEDRLRLIAEFPEAKFSQLLSKEKGAAVRICSKNEKLAAALREKGNLAYAQGDTDGALHLYNQCLQYSEPGPELGLVFANRSAVWIDRKRWKLSIADIDSALALEYPTEKRYKLLERKALCLYSMGQREEADAVVNSVLKEVPNMKKGQQTRIRTKMEQVKTSGKRIVPEKEEEEFKSKEIELTEPHPLYPSFSTAIQVDFAPGRGRFCVAERNISAGELIALDTPYTAMIDKEEVRKLCWNCFRALVSPVPCEGCSGILFCSFKCRDEAKCYHHFECTLTDLFFQASIGAWVLAFRALVKQPASFYLNDKKSFLKHDEQVGFKASEVYASQDLRTFHNLVTHDGGGNKEAPELMMQALTTIFLLRCLQFKNYLPEEPSDKLTSNELFFAQILHHHMRVAYFNTHELTAVSSNSASEIKVRRVGRGTNPTLALINHSCDPNYRRITQGNRTLGFASRAIAAGEEICDTYCETYVARKKADRAKSLQKYNFTCACRPCSEEWATGSGLPEKLTGLPKEMYHVDVDTVKAAAKKLTNLELSVMKKLSRAEGSVQALEEVLSMQKSYCKDLDAVLKPPHVKLCTAEAHLYQLLMKMYASRG